MNIVMPKLGLTMTEATLTRWHKQAGEEARQGEILFEFESEKSVMEYECPADGRLVRLLVAEGETVPCGTPVAEFEPVSARAYRSRAGPSPAPPSRSAPAAGPQANLRPVSWSPPPRPAPGSELNLDLAGRLAAPPGRVQLADVDAGAQPPFRPPPPSPKRVAADLG